MQINARELNGIFQVECHTSSIRLLWIIFISISLSIVAYGVLAVKANLFDLSLDVGLKYFEIVFAILLFLVVPAVIFFVGLIKIIKKPGIYFTGVRIVNKGIEIGTFTLNVNPVSPNKIWENKFIAADMVEWRQKKNFYNNTLNILIIIRKRYELSKQFLLERVVFSSRDKCLFQMFGHNSSGIHRNNLVAISQGSLHLLGNDDGIYPDDLLSFREQTADIVSRWKPSFGLSCTLKTIPSLANIDNVLALSVLGGMSATGAKKINDKESIEKIFDSFNNEKNSSVDFDQD